MCTCMCACVHVCMYRASEMPSSGGSRREATVEAKEEKRLRAAHLHV